MVRIPLIAALLGLAAASAHALCTSDKVPQAQALLERFINADCEACWRDPATPQAPAGTLALDWVLPGAQGENAPLATVAVDEAAERLAFLKKTPPERATSVASRRAGKGAPLRIALGDAFNDYVGVSMELKMPGQARWNAWLLLVEQLPAGVEGSPVPRNLVRGVFRPDWSRPASVLEETRAMRVAEGVRPERLRLVAVLQDGHGEIRAITETGCPE
ncbi:hypothetical protein [Ramlibacter agri]|uniref:hypothetical protein n=1 Tax=Ramlibacter agri TaxID=2728837 RepID=UPI00197D6E7D|nr:hypothetical protein [Ramlibacter agri]